MRLLLFPFLLLWTILKITLMLLLIPFIVALEILMRGISRVIRQSR